MAVALFIAIALPEGMPHQSLWGFLAGAIAFEFLGKTLMMRRVNSEEWSMNP